MATPLSREGGDAWAATQPDLHVVVGSGAGPRRPARRHRRGPAAPPDRYSGAAYRYLLGAARDPDAADDLYQEFCLRVLRGDFKNASPERGNFRSFLKTALFHLVVNHQHRLKKRAAPLSGAAAEPAAGAATSEDEQAFLDGWREELMQ